MILYGNAFVTEHIDFIRDNGLGFEVFQYCDPVYLDGFNTNHPEITKFLSGMRGASLHGAFYDLNYTSVDPMICDVSKKRFIQIINAASFHGINRIVFHSAYKKFFDGFSDEHKERYLEKAVGFWKGFADNIPDGTTIYIENIEDDDPDLFYRLINGIGSSKVRCCLDVGHAHCNANVSVGKWIDTLGSLIGHVHLHDNDGSGDQHLPLGKGTIPLACAIEKIIEKSGDDVVFVLECDAPESIKWLESKGLYKIEQ